ncbi:MAG: aminotransferase class V-fold PLP-dependent enzyme [Polyangiaceae bacterium]|nr:aminotransferase class V-fold PLP-dependent enzyme [Polyangiaceae bacterium]
MKLPVYMDHHATTPVDPRVLQAMIPYFSTVFGNAASQHAFGWEANTAVDHARESVAALIGARSASEIVFTSGATEANNLALKGVAEYYRQRRNHVVTTVVEHHSVLDVCRRLEQLGLALSTVKVGPDGRVDPADIERAMTDRTLVVSVMLANNEIGTIQPIAEIGSITRARGVLLHCDASQGLGSTGFDVQRMNVDLASLSAHKFYGPKGAGALYVRGNGPRVRLTAGLDGGGHERGMRSGTLNVPAIVGLGAACRLLAETGAADAQRVRAQRDRLYRAIVEGADDIVLNGPAVEQGAARDGHAATHPAERLPGNLNLSVVGFDSAALLSELQRDVAISSGSACSSLALEPSHVIRATAGEKLARCALRFGLGRFTTDEEVDYVAEAVLRAVRTLRG